MSHKVLHAIVREEAIHLSWFSPPLQNKNRKKIDFQFYGFSHKLEFSICLVMFETHKTHEKIQRANDDFAKI